MDLFNKQKSGVSGRNIGLSPHQMTHFCNLFYKAFLPFTIKTTDRISLSLVAIRVDPISRSSRPEVFCKTSTLKSLSNFMGKHLR